MMDKMVPNTLFRMPAHFFTANSLSELKQGAAVLGSCVQQVPPNRRRNVIPCDVHVPRGLIATKVGDGGGVSDVQAVTTFQSK